MSQRITNETFYILCFVLTLWNLGCVLHLEHVPIWTSYTSGAPWAHVASAPISGSAVLGTLLLALAAKKQCLPAVSTGRNHSLIEGYSQCCGYFGFHQWLYSGHRAHDSCWFLLTKHKWGFLSLTHSTEQQRINKIHQSYICHSDWGRWEPKLAQNWRLALFPRNSDSVSLDGAVAVRIIFYFLLAKVGNNFKYAEFRDVLKSKICLAFHRERELANMSLVYDFRKRLQSFCLQRKLTPSTLFGEVDWGWRGRF